MSKRYNYLKAWALCMAIVVPFSCSDDEDPIPVPVANFTSAVDGTNPQKVNFTNTSTDATSYEWNFGDGSTVSTEESPSHIYTEGGTFNVTLTAKSAGGTHTKTSAVTVEDPIVEPVDHIVGGDMTDEEAWTIEGAGAPSQTTVEFVEGKMVVSNGENVQSNVKIYQAVEVEAGKEYTFSANIKGAGASNSWLEILFGDEAPVADTDYSDGMYTGLNTWDGCGGSAFEANLATFGCKAGAAGNGQNGKITFANSGTIYLVIKAGSWDGTLGTGGIEIDDVKFTSVD